MKKNNKLISLAAVLIIAATAIRGAPQRPISRNDVSRGTSATATLIPTDSQAPTATATDGPRCKPPAYYDPYMDTCRLPEDGPTVEPISTEDPNPFDYEDGSITQWCDYGTEGRHYWTQCVGDGTPTPEYLP